MCIFMWSGFSSNLWTKPLSIKSKIVGHYSCHWLSEMVLSLYWKLSQIVYLHGGLLILYTDRCSWRIVNLAFWKMEKKWLTLIALWNFTTMVNSASGWLTVQISNHVHCMSFIMENCDQTFKWYLRHVVNRAMTSQHLVPLNSNKFELELLIRW